MFTKARIKLTAWYLLIIMLISISFSVVIYRASTLELDRIERVQRLRRERQLPGEVEQRVPRAVIDPEVIEETSRRLVLILFGINGAIFIVAGVAGYFLAGRTLRPIGEMLDEQNRFVTDASHQLRTPLTSLKSEIEVNLRDKNLNLKDAKKLLESNLEEVNKLQYLSDNLIKLTQYPKKDLGNFVMVSLLTVVQEAMKKVTNLAKQKKIIINNNVKNISIEGDYENLVELFVILLDNAIKYSSSNTKVVITSKRLDHVVEVEVRDQGVGITKEDLSHVFERFYRSDKSKERTQISGYGLGLSIAKQIVEKHHGNIRVESKIGQGTTFFIQLSKVDKF